ALDMLAGLTFLVLLGLVSAAGRRWTIQRKGGTFDCSLRLKPKDEGKGWMFGTGRYTGARVEWYRVFSLAPRPREVIVRSEVEVLRRRAPDEAERLALFSGEIILECLQRGRLIELAMSEDALTGFLSWLEAAPPGQRINVA
ncbi:MAG: DUF2550 domain-containing protein, partial [Streptomycetales bacterium]